MAGPGDARRAEVPLGHRRRAPWLAATIHPAFPGAPWQRCRVHALRNLLRHALSLDAWARRKTWLCCTTPAVTAAVHGHRRACRATPLSAANKLRMREEVDALTEPGGDWRLAPVLRFLGCALDDLAGAAHGRRAVSGTRPQAAACLLGGLPGSSLLGTLHKRRRPAGARCPNRPHPLWGPLQPCPEQRLHHPISRRPVRSRTPRFTSFLRRRATRARGRLAP